MGVTTRHDMAKKTADTAHTLCAQARFSRWSLSPLQLDSLVCQLSLDTHTPNCPAVRVHGDLKSAFERHSQVQVISNQTKDPTWGTAVET
jgi:hypothetical protein